VISWFQAFACKCSLYRYRPARAAVEKAREEWDRHDVDGGSLKSQKGKKARKAQELADEMEKTEYKQVSSEKWWDGKKPEEEEPEEEPEEEKEDDADPATKARRARNAEAEALERDMNAEERLGSIRERIAVACQGVLEDPEGKWTDLRDVVKLVEDYDPEVARLGALSMVLVFRDICPGYRIRPPTEKELQMKVSKDVMKLRDFEAGLLKLYQGFIKVMVRSSGGKKTRSQRGKGGPDAPTALRCLCGLLEGLPHFNFRTDVLSALVPHVGNTDSAAAETVAAALGGAIKADLAGDLTLDALHMVAQLVKQNKCAAHPAALVPFLEIRFDEGILALEATQKQETMSRKQTRKKRADERELIRKGRAEKQKKIAEKERLKSFGHNADSDSDEDDNEDALARDMDEGAGRMDNAQKRKLQSRMLEATFEMYFRVLKNAASVMPAKGIPLMTPALIGLGRFTHLISVGFMADLMEVFRVLLSGTALAADQKARVLLTACEILSGHGEALHVDTGEFHRQLYAMLGQPSVGSGGWTAAVSGGAAAAGTDDDAADRGTLRVRTLQKFLAGYKQVDQGRVAAFAKRLAGTALMAEAGEAVGALGVTRQLMASYPRTRCLLENERVGTGVFNMQVDDPETAVGLAAVLWDLALLRHHYHPAVSAAAAEVASLPLQGSVAPALGSHAPAELARLHSTTRGNFRPAIPPPKPGKKAKNSVLDRTTSKGGEKRVLHPGPELTALVESDAKRFKRSSGGEGGARGAGGDVVGTLRRYFLETTEFGVNAELRREAARLRRFTQKMRAHTGEKRRKAAAAAAQKKKKLAASAAAAEAGAEESNTKKVAGSEKGTPGGSKKVRKTLGGVADAGVVKKKKKKAATAVQ
jgi:nucleolar complex protein 3